jgi:pimeloyl-ACP methyl ester carboxylesterase
MPILELPDVRLNYLSLGPTEPADDDRPPFLLIHGLAANLAFWYARIAPALARRHRVVMFDLRGHGRSSMPKTGYACSRMADDVCALLDHLRIDRAHVVGHSFGGNVALHFACRWPERMASLTMADVRVRAVQPRVDLQAWSAWPRMRDCLAQVGVVVDESAEEVGFELFNRIARVRLEATSTAEQSPVLALSPFAGAGGEAAARLWLKLIETTSAPGDLVEGAGVTLEEIRRVAAPTLLVYGENSQTMPTAVGLQGILPSARLEVAAGVGHFFPTKRPELLIGPLLGFVADIGAVPASCAPRARGSADEVGLVHAAAC